MLAGVVHNASSYGATSLDDVTAELALAHFKVNALAPLLLTQSLAEALRSAQGAVVLFSDIHVLGRPRRNMLAYSMSKAAATDLVATLALELAPEGIRINLVAASFEGESPDAAQAARALARTVVFLSDPDLGLSGETLLQDDNAGLRMGESRQPRGLNV